MRLLLDLAGSNLVQTLLNYTAPPPTPRSPNALVILSSMSAMVKKTSSLIKLFLYNHSISDVSAGLNNTRQSDFVKAKAKISIFVENLTRVPLKLEKSENRQFL